MTTEQTILQAIIDASRRLTTVSEATLETILDEPPGSAKIYQHVLSMKRKGVNIQQTTKGRTLKGRQVRMYEFWIPANELHSVQTLIASTLKASSGGLMHGKSGNSAMIDPTEKNY